MVNKVNKGKLHLHCDKVIDNCHSYNKSWVVSVYHTTYRNNSRINLVDESPMPPSMFTCIDFIDFYTDCQDVVSFRGLYEVFLA